MLCAVYARRRLTIIDAATAAADRLLYSDYNRCTSQQSSFTSAHCDQRNGYKSNMVRLREKLCDAVRLQLVLWLWWGETRTQTHAALRLRMCVHLCASVRYVYVIACTRYASLHSSTHTYSWGFKVRPCDIFIRVARVVNAIIFSFRFGVLCTHAWVSTAELKFCNDLRGDANWKEHSTKAAGKYALWETWATEIIIQKLDISYEDSIFGVCFSVQPLQCMMVLPLDSARRFRIDKRLDASLSQTWHRTKSRLRDNASSVSILCSAFRKRLRARNYKFTELMHICTHEASSATRWENKHFIIDIEYKILFCLRVSSVWIRINVCVFWPLG